MAAYAPTTRASMLAADIGLYRATGEDAWLDKAKRAGKAAEPAVAAIQQAVASAPVIDSANAGSERIIVSNSGRSSTAQVVASSATTLAPRGFYWFQLVEDEDEDEDEDEGGAEVEAGA